MGIEPWPVPPVRAREDGSPRRVGVEIELQGIRVAELAELVAGVLGGEWEERSSAEYRVIDRAERPWRVEVDFQLLKELAEQATEDEPFRNLLVDALGAASSLVVPCEIVSPPLPVTDLSDSLGRLAESLHEAGARGTRHTPWYAFGVHLNVDPPDLETGTLLAYLRAFICAYDWLVWHGRVDPARRLTPYIDAYPRAYDLLVTDPEYAPDRQLLIDDYLAHNPTRNRALDLLPLLMHVNGPRVRSVVDDPLVKPRPALHYRLANSSLDEPDWSLRQPWTEWVALERLASDADALEACCIAFRRHREQLLHPVRSAWRKEVARWLDP